MADNDRLKKEGTDPNRVSRTLEERAQTEDRQLTDQERLEAFQSTFFKEALPELPPIPGYHSCWLTTTNPRDSVAMRTRLGYELIRVDELGPGWANLSVKTGEAYAGCVMVNEMIAAKLPLRLYEMFMREAHHDGPNREQEKLTQVVDQIREEAERRKARLEEEEGMRELRRTVRAPTFAQ